MDSLESAISSYIIELLGQSPVAEVPGSTLGVWLAQKFPSVNFRAQYGGLRRFIEAKCGGDVVLVGMEGGNHVFALRNRATAQAKPGEARQLAPVGVQAGLWKAFSDPNIHARIYFNNANFELAFTSGSQVPPGATEIAKLSAGDYKKFAEAFTLQASEPLRPELSEALKSSNFWPAWMSALSNIRDPQLFYAWLNFRIQEIKGILRQRLAEAGYPEPKVDAAVEKAYRDKQRKTVEPAPPAPQPARPDPHESNPTNVAELIHKVIDRMTLEQLRQLNVPLGAVLDAIQSE